jgi:hypothetical protein
MLKFHGGRFQKSDLRKGPADKSHPRPQQNHRNKIRTGNMISILKEEKITATFRAFQNRL